MYTPASAMLAVSLAFGFLNWYTFEYITYNYVKVLNKKVLTLPFQEGNPVDQVVPANQTQYI